MWYDQFFELRVTSIKHKISISVIIKTSQSYRFYNRVHSRIILEKTGVKWDTGFGFGSSRQWHPKAKENQDRIFYPYKRYRSLIFKGIPTSKKFVHRSKKSSFVQVVNKNQSVPWTKSRSQRRRLRPTANSSFVNLSFARVRVRVIDHPFFNSQKYVALPKITKDRQRTSINTLQWFTQLSVEDQVLCQVLTFKSKGNVNQISDLLLGIPYWNIVNKKKYNIVRPLLNLSRGSLTTLCKALHLPVYPDKSNNAVQYSRNRLREQIFPAIKLFLNPKIENALFKLADLLIQDFSVVSYLINTGHHLTYK